MSRKKLQGINDYAKNRGFLHFPIDAVKKEEYNMIHKNSGNVSRKGAVVRHPH